MVDYINCLVEGMFRYIGQTVTIFTTSGGLSGNGFTGVLLSADCNVVRLLADIGACRIIIPPRLMFASLNINPVPVKLKALY